VADVAVVGLPDPRLGAVPAAVVEARAGRPAPSSEALMAFARRELVAYQAPTQIRVVEALPRTPSLKVDKAAVRALFEPPQTGATASNGVP
jgi:acyl-CoA synthetase (AMP-forming)/AMP-acid ligase II